MHHNFNTLYLDKRRVLIVDNAIDHIRLLATILEIEGYEIETAICGYTAIAKIEANPPDVVLLDLMMPRINGVEVAKWIRQNYPDIAVVLVTSDYELEEAPIHKVKLDGLITKPIDFDEVISTMQAIFSQKLLYRFVN